MRTLIVVAVMFVANFAQAQGGQCLSPADGGAAVARVRLLNTAEHIFFRSNAHYADLQELAKSPALEEAKRLMGVNDSDKAPITEPVAGFQTRLGLQPDRQGYELFMMNSSSGCKTSFVTTHEGLIYTAQPI